MNRINLICLGVRDIKKSLAFYQGIGFKTYEKADNPPIVFFDNQGSKLELYPLEELAKDINAQTPPSSPPRGFCGITLACSVQSREEVNAIIDTAKECGGVVAKPPQDVFWGGYSGYFQDPDGYYWEVAYSSSWKFDENDMLIIDDSD